MLALPRVMLNRSAETRDSVTESEMKAMVLRPGLSSRDADVRIWALAVADIFVAQFVTGGPPPPVPLPEPPTGDAPIIPVVSSGRTLPSR